MTETKKKRESIIICLAVVVAYIAMYILTILYKNAIAPGIQIGYVLKVNIESMVIALVLALIPYERLNYIWHRDIVGYWFETKSKNNARNMLIEAGVLYLLFSVACIWINDFFFRWDTRSIKLMTFFVTVFVAWILVNIFELIKNNIGLFIVSHLFIIANGVAVYLMTGGFYAAALITFSLVVGWNVCNFMSDRKYKLLNLLASVLCSAEMFNIAVDVTGKYRALDAWLNPDKEINLPYSWELKALSQHSLKLPEDFPWYRQFNHPFLAINSHLGIGALILMFLAFVIITVAYIKSRKILTENRFKLLSFIYAMFAVLYVYMLLSDLGFVPTPGGVLLVSVKTYIVGIGIMIRLFIRREVPESVIMSFEYRKANDADDDFFERVMIKDMIDMKDIQRKTSAYMLDYMAYQTHKLNLIDDNLDKIYSMLGEVKIVENEDGYSKSVKRSKGKPIQGVVELQEKILDLYRYQGDKTNDGE